MEKETPEEIDLTKMSDWALAFRTVILALTVIDRKEKKDAAYQYADTELTKAVPEILNRDWEKALALAESELELRREKIRAEIKEKVNL